MDFYSRSNKPPKQDTPEIYSQFEPVYSLVVNKDGKEELKQTGKTNVYEKIQEYKDECDINKIIERYERGDVDAINRVSGIYADVTKYPKTLAEAQQILINAEKDFNTLPKELKKEFNNSYKEFIAKMSTNDGIEIFEKYNNQKFGKIDMKKAENQNNEQNSNGIQNNGTNQNGGVIYE